MKWANVMLAWCVLACAAAGARAQDQTAEFLSRLEKINRDYYLANMYPPVAGSFTALFNPLWEAKQKKRQAVRETASAFKGRQVDAVLFQRVQDGVKYSDALFVSAEQVLPGLRADIQKSGLDAFTAWVIEDPAQFVFGFQSYIVKSFLLRKEMAKHVDCRREEQEFSSNWDAYIQQLAKNNPAYEKFARRPDSSNPLTGLTLPPIRLPAGEGMTFEKPHRVGVLVRPIEETIEKTTDSWHQVYQVRVDKPQRLTADLTPTEGLAGIRIHESLGGKNMRWLRHTTGRPAEPGRLEVEARPGVDYFIEIFHIRRDGIDPLWSGTDAKLQIWLGDDRPAAFVNLKEHKALARQDVATTIETIQAALVRDVLYAGTSRDARAAVRFFATYTFDAKTQRISGMHEYPDNESAVTRIDGSIKMTAGGVEIQIKETELVRKGRGIATGAQYILRAELHDGRLSLTGSTGSDRASREVAIEDADGPESLQRAAELRFRKPGADTTLPGEVVLTKGGTAKVRLRIEPGRNGALNGSLNCGEKKVTIEFGGTITPTPLGFFFDAKEDPKKVKDPKDRRVGASRVSSFSGIAKWHDVNRVLEVKVSGGGELDGVIRVEMPTGGR